MGEQHNWHVLRRQRWIVGRRCAAYLVETLPDADAITADDAVAWLRAMEAVLRVAYAVPGQINIERVTR